MRRQEYDASGPGFGGRQSLLEESLFPADPPPAAPRRVDRDSYCARVTAAAILLGALLSTVWTLWLGYGLVALVTQFLRWLAT